MGGAEVGSRRMDERGTGREVPEHVASRRGPQPRVGAQRGKRDPRKRGNKRDPRKPPRKRGSGMLQVRSVGVSTGNPTPRPGRGPAAELQLAVVCSPSTGAESDGEQRQPRQLTSAGVYDDETPAPPARSGVVSRAAEQQDFCPIYRSSVPNDVTRQRGRERKSR